MCIRDRRRRAGAYSSYGGEVTPAPPNLVRRDFRSALPNFLWLTDCYRQWKIGQLRYCKLPNGVTPVYPTSTTPSQPSYGSLLLSVGTSLSL